MKNLCTLLSSFHFLYLAFEKQRSCLYLIPFTVWKNPLSFFKMYLSESPSQFFTCSWVVFGEALTKNKISLSSLCSVDYSFQSRNFFFLQCSLSINLDQQNDLNWVFLNMLSYPWLSKFHLSPFGSDQAQSNNFWTCPSVS